MSNNISKINLHCLFTSNVKVDVNVYIYTLVLKMFPPTQTCTGCTYCDLCEVTGEIDKVDKIVAIDNQRLAVGQVGVTELSPLQ